MNRNIKKILRRRKEEKGGPSYNEGREEHEAAAVIQACYYGMKGRKEFEKKRRRAQKRQNRYGGFSVADVRNELANSEMLPSLPPTKKMPLGGGAFHANAPSPSSLGSFNGRRPNRLAPLDHPVAQRLQQEALPRVVNPKLKPGRMAPLISGR